MVFDRYFEYTSSGLNGRASERSWLVLKTENGYHHRDVISLVKFQKISAFDCSR